MLRLVFRTVVSPRTVASPLRSFARTMSTPTLYNFLVYAPDYADAYERRLAVRPRHFEGVKSLIEAGTIKFGGALIAPDTHNTPGQKIVGSSVLFQAPDIETVRKLIESDVYWKENVWDKEKVVITPFLLAAPAEWKL